MISGRWQIYHKGHETLMNTALAKFERVIVVIGSAYRSRNPNNPFLVDERQAMITSTLSEADRGRVDFVGVRDYYCDEKWVAAVIAAVKQVRQGAGPITLIGFKKDDTGYYQDLFPEFGKIMVQQEHVIDATHLRDVFFEGTDPDSRLAVLAPYVSPGVIAYLQAWSRLPFYAQRVSEHKAAKAYRAEWGNGPFPTSDAVVTVTVNDVLHLLLEQRSGEGNDCGAGLFNIPGGFLDPGERHYECAVRELDEETGLKLLPLTMRHALKSVKMFDHPRRSARARLITQVFHFDLGRMTHLPEVRPSKEALAVFWAPKHDLHQYVTNMLDDHDVIVDDFVGVYPAVAG